MRLSDKYAVPREIALLYDFVNSLDNRSYFESGTMHVASDELATPAQLRSWLRERSLKGKAGNGYHQQVVRLRDAIRSFLQIAPDTRRNTTAGRHLQDASASFPLVLHVDDDRAVALRPLDESHDIARVLAELHGLAASDRLHRLKMCASEECEWVYFDRSKPGNRRWCSSARCGNREKTRKYRARHRTSGQT